MKKVNIAFNRQVMHPTSGTYYRGCFTLSRTLFEQFTGRKGTSNEEHYLKVSETKKLIAFLKFHKILFQQKRACGQFNYYIRIIEDNMDVAS